MGYRTLHHVSEVVELMAEVLHHLPTLRACPFVRMFRVHSARCVEIAVGFLSGSHNYEHTVYIVLQFLVGISLEKIACALDSLVDVGIVKSETTYVYRIARMGCVDEISVSSCLLAFTESEGYCHFATRLQALSPEIIGDFHRGEGHRINRIAMMGGFLIRFSHSRDSKGGYQGGGE